VADDIRGGLEVARQPGQHGWSVIHVQSGLRIEQPLRLQRQARAVRASLLATGIDFSRPRTTLRQAAARRAIKAAFRDAASKFPIDR